MINTEPVQVQDDELSLFSDDESVGSIFSSLGEEEEDGAPTPIPKELDSEFKRRDELMDQLVKDIEPKYALAMKKIEQAVRNERMMCRFNQIDITGTNLDGKIARTSISSHSSSSTSLENQDSAYSCIGWIERIKYRLPLGMTIRLQGLMILLLNCVAYNAGENLIRSMVVFVSDWDEDFENRAGFPACMMLVSFVILCLTGGIYDFINNDSMERIKFDMTNRLLDGKWDARIIKWFRCHEELKTTLNVMSFFTFVYSVEVYQQQLMESAFNIRRELLQGLPSSKQGVITYPSKWLAGGLPDWNVQPIPMNASCVTGVCNLAEFHDLITRQDEAYLASEMSVDSFEDLLGNPTAVLVTESVQFWYYLGSAFVAIALLRMVGHKFWSI